MRYEDRLAAADDAGALRLGAWMQNQLRLRKLNAMAGDERAIRLELDDHLSVWEKDLAALKAKNASAAEIQSHLQEWLESIQYLT